VRKALSAARIKAWVFIEASLSKCAEFWREGGGRPVVGQILKPFLIQPMLLKIFGSH
jgi:hypothetical protein